MLHISHMSQVMSVLSHPMFHYIQTTSRSFKVTCT